MRTMIALLLGIFASVTLTGWTAESANAGERQGPQSEQRRAGSDQSRRGQRAERGEGDESRNRRPRPTAVQLIERMDRDGDQKLSREEAPERMGRHFDKLDNDADGFVSADELQAMMDRRNKQGRGDRRGKGGQGEKGDRGDRGSQGKRDPAKMIEKVDADGDGKISKTEMPEKLQKRFEKLDANADGFIDLNELKSAAQKREGGKRKGDGKQSGRRGGGSDLSPIQPKAPPAELP